MFSYSEFTDLKSAYKEPVSKDYRVFVNGKEVPVYTCRVSAYPFNRPWPGYQRSTEQAENASFVNLVSDEELKIEIQINREYKKAILKPYSKGIKLEEKNAAVSFNLCENGQFVFQTDSYHGCLHIFNSKPWECKNKADVTYYFGPGIHMPGSITLHDNESIYVDKDALVFGNIFAENAENIHIFGNGLFDDSCEERFSPHCYGKYPVGNVKFLDCKGIKLEGVLFRNSAMWCVNIFHCFDVELSDIKVFGQWRYNTDGVDIVNSQNVLLKDSFVHSFDDTVTIKAIDDYVETSCINITTENCVLWCDWGKPCEVGLETACKEYKNIIFRNCDVLRGGDNALDIQNGDCAEVSNVLFENINIDYNAYDTPEIIQKKDGEAYPARNEIAIPYLIRIRNDRFREQYPGHGAIPDFDRGDAEFAGVHDITYRNICVYYDEEIPKMCGKYNVPISIKSTVDGVRFYNIRISGIYINGKKLEEPIITAENADVYFE